MATVKFDEGEKFETSLNLEEGEGVIFVKPPKSRMERSIGNPTRQWTVTLVITNKRVVSIPQPPNKKNYLVESFYFKDITNAEVQKSQTLEDDAR
jgi:hypothetical protein